MLPATSTLHPRHTMLLHPCGCRLHALQDLDRDISEAWSEWGAEKDELLASLKKLDQQMLLKDAVIEAFIPPVGRGGSWGLGLGWREE